MFFIFGSPRSGTTLLAQCLSASEDILIPYETDFIIPLAFIYDRVRDEETGRELIYKLITKSDAFRRHIGEYLKPRDVFDAIYRCPYHPAAMLDSLYDQLARKTGVAIAGDKSPNDLGFLRILIKTNALENKKIVHIVRDVRDVVVSLENTDWGAGTSTNFPRTWTNANLYIHGLFSQQDEQYMLIRYEDMVAAPEQVIERACEFLGAEFRADMLLPENRHKRYKKMHQNHPGIAKPINTSRIGIHKNVLTGDELARVEQQAHAALLAFGYLG